MAKYKLACTLSAAAIILGAFVFVPAGQVFAYTEDVDGYAVTVGDTDEERYNDLKLAISDGRNVRLGGDISHYVTVSNAPSILIDHSMTLDLNGFTLSTASTSGGSAGNTSITVQGDGTVLTIQDSVGGGAIRYDHTGNASPTTLRIEAGAKALLTGGTISTPYGKNGEGIGVNMKGEGATFEMTGGSIVSHNESQSVSNYGVRFNSAGDLKLTGGEIATIGSAVAVPNSNQVSVDIAGNVLLTSTSGKAIDITSANTSGTVSGLTLKDVTIAGSVALNNVTVSGNLEAKSGERALSGVSVGGGMTISGGTTNVTNLTVAGATNITAGNTTFGNNVQLNGGVTYQSAVTASLTINDGTTVTNFAQVGKTVNVSYTDKDTKEKVQRSYDTYGTLIINGGIFGGSFAVATTDQIAESNAARLEYVESYNEHSGKTPLVYNDVAVAPEVAGGVFTAEPDAGSIEEGKSVYHIADGYVVVDDAELASQNLEYADDNEDGIYQLEPIKIDWDGDWVEALYNGEYAVYVDFNSEVLADRLADLSAEEKDTSTLTLVNGGKILKAIEMDMVNRDGVRIEVNNADLTVYIDISKEEYDELSKYDKLEIAYFDENGNEAERIATELVADGDWYWVQFNTTHLSTYGVVGVSDEAVEEEASQGTSDTATPQTGTMTIAGASATNAAIVTAIAIGLLTSIVSFAYLIRRR